MKDSVRMFSLLRSIEVEMSTRDTVTEFDVHCEQGDSVNYVVKVSGYRWMIC